MTVPNGESGINPPDFGVTNDGTIPNLPARSQTVAENFYKAKVQGSPSWTASSPIFTQVVNALIGAVFDAIADAVGTIPIAGPALADIIDGFADWLTSTANTAQTAQATAESKSKVTKGSSAPSSPAVSDIWIDTSTGSNVYKVWNGSAWVVTTDKIAIDAANAASTAQSTADTANTTATSAMATASAAETAVASKASLSQVPIYSPLWLTIRDDEECSFPRLNLNFGSAASTSSADGTGSHSHPLTGIPDYQPAGNGANLLEMNFIRIPRDREFTKVGFITGNNVVALGISAFKIWIYSVNLSTGALTLLNTANANTDLRSSVGATNTEYRFSIGQTITAPQGSVIGVGLLQQTSAFQTCWSIIRQSVTNLNPPAGTVFPRKNYCYVNAGTTAPSTIAESSLNYSASTKVGFVCLAA